MRLLFATIGWARLTVEDDNQITRLVEIKKWIAKISTRFGGYLTFLEECRMLLLLLLLLGKKKRWQKISATNLFTTKCWYLIEPKVKDFVILPSSVPKSVYWVSVFSIILYVYQPFVSHGVTAPLVSYINICPLCRC